MIRHSRECKWFYMGSVIHFENIIMNGNVTVNNAENIWIFRKKFAFWCSLQSLLSIIATNNRNNEFRFRGILLIDFRTHDLQYMTLCELQDSEGQKRVCITCSVEFYPIPISSLTKFVHRKYTFFENLCNMITWNSICWNYFLLMNNFDFDGFAMI